MLRAAYAQLVPPDRDAEEPGVVRIFEIPRPTAATSGPAHAWSSGTDPQRRELVIQAQEQRPRRDDGDHPP